MKKKFITSITMLLVSMGLAYNQVQAAEVPSDTGNNTEEEVVTEEKTAEDNKGESVDENKNIEKQSAGWQKNGSKTYYVDEKGNKKTGWLDLNGEKYYFNSEGVMLTGWQAIGVSRYYFDNNGVMLKGWQTINGVKYHFDVEGKESIGWNNVDGRRYYFAESGTVGAVYSNRVAQINISLIIAVVLQELYILIELQK